MPACVWPMKDSEHLEDVNYLQNVSCTDLFFIPTPNLVLTLLTSCLHTAMVTQLVSLSNQYSTLLLELWLVPCCKTFTSLLGINNQLLSQAFNAPHYITPTYISSFSLSLHMGLSLGHSSCLSVCCSYCFGLNLSPSEMIK